MDCGYRDSHFNDFPARGHREGQTLNARQSEPKCKTNAEEDAHRPTRDSTHTCSAAPKHTNHLFHLAQLLHLYFLGCAGADLFQINALELGELVCPHLGPRSHLG